MSILYHIIYDSLFTVCRALKDYPCIISDLIRFVTIEIFAPVYQISGREAEADLCKMSSNFPWIFTQNLKRVRMNAVEESYVQITILK